MNTKKTNKEVKEDLTQNKETEKETSSLEEKIIELKKKYPKLYRNIIGNNIVIWKPISRLDYKNIRNLEIPADIKDDEDEKLFFHQKQIVLTAVVYPENMEDIINETELLVDPFADIILGKSGFDISRTETL